MRTFLLTLTVVFSALTASAAAPETLPEIIIGLSPFQPAAERAKQQALLQRFIVADCPNGSRVIVWDGWALTVVCDMQLPILRFDSPAARAPRVASALAALKQWFVGQDDRQSEAALRESGTIKVPEWLYAATAQPSTSHRTILILASPFCIVPNEPSFSMIETRYPSDGHLNAGDKSIYSIAAKRGRLANTTVLWSYGTETVWASQNHREHVARWWSLFIAGQGTNATLAAFNADTPQVMFAATRTNHRSIGEYSVNPDDIAVVMHTAVLREVPVKIQVRAPESPEVLPVPVARVEPQAVSVPVAVAVVTPAPAERRTPPTRLEPSVPAPGPEPPSKSVQETVVAIPVPPEIPKPAVGNIGIATVWNAERGTDIDIRVAAKPGLPEAYWNKPRVERVRLFRDIRTAQAVGDNARWQSAWEYVEVQDAKLEEPSVWLNVYDARGPVNGIVRVQFKGQVVDWPFKFEIADGNRGRDSNIAARLRSPYWLQVRLDEVFRKATTEHTFNAGSK